MINEVNTVTGQTKNNRGKTFSYNFAADGTYTFVGYMESTMFGCTTALFNQINGRYMVDGSNHLSEPLARFLEKHVFVLPEFEQIADEDPDEKIAGIRF